MALTSQEVEKVNELFKQIDDIQTQIKTKDERLQEKEILLGKTRVSLNEKQSIIAQRDAEIKKLTDIVKDRDEKIDDKTSIEDKIQQLSNKVDKLIAATSKTPAKRTTRSTKTVKKK